VDNSGGLWKAIGGRMRGSIRTIQREYFDAARD
jgi:hypothetical protein